MRRSASASNGGGFSESLGRCVNACTSHPVVYYSFQGCRWIPVLFIVAAVCWGYYAYVVALCFFTIENILKKVIYLLLFHVFIFMFLWAYYQTIFSNIGRPHNRFTYPEDVRSEIKHAQNPVDVRQTLERFVRHNDLPIMMRSYDGGIRYCEKCDAIKPDRSHHCSVCGHCILKFDHHCPWVNTCVNYRNYKFFIQFLGYALLFCAYVFLTDLEYFVRFWTERQFDSSQPSRFHILFMLFVSGMFAISVSVLFFYHLWLTGKNRSTIESFRAPIFTYGPDKNGFNLGWRENFKEVFGETAIQWFLPIFTSRGDGESFAIPVYNAEVTGLLNGRHHQPVTVEDSCSDESDTELLTRNADGFTQLSDVRVIR